MIAQIAPAALRARLAQSEGELALLDVREQGAFARGHILLASNAPLSRLEIEAPRLVPRRGAAVVLCDGGDGAGGSAPPRRSTRYGYRDVAVLDGGVAGLVGRAASRCSRASTCRARRSANSSRRPGAPPI